MNARTIVIVMVMLIRVTVFAGTDDESACFDIQSCGNGRIQGGAFVGTCMQSCSRVNCPTIIACSDGVIEYGVTHCSKFIDEPVNTLAHQESVAKIHTTLSANRSTNTIINLGTIAQEKTVSLVIPPLNQQSVYTYVPTQGALAGKPITLVIRSFVRTFKKAKKEVVGIYATMGNNLEDIQHIETITPKSAIKTIDAVRAHGATVILPDGNIQITSLPKQAIPLNSQNNPQNKEGSL